MVVKELEVLAADSEKWTAHVEESANITVDITAGSVSVIPQGKQIRNK